MKSDTERKIYYTEKLHKRKNRLHVHLSKDLRAKGKKRALLVRKGDSVRIMRGPQQGKEAKVADVNVVRRVVFLEGIVAKTARGKEVLIPIQPSNLLLIGLEATKERKKIFSDDAFKKKEIKKAEDGKKAEEGKVAGAEENGATEEKDVNVAATKHERTAPESHKVHRHEPQDHNKM